MAVATLTTRSFAREDHRTERYRSTFGQGWADGACATPEALATYLAAMKPKVIETQRGRWDELVYTLPLGVDTNSAIKLELGYLGGMIQREFLFKGSSNSSGPITLERSSGELGTMPALVVGKQGNK